MNEEQKHVPAPVASSSPEQVDEYLKSQGCDLEEIDKEGLFKQIQEAWQRTKQ